MGLEAGVQNRNTTATTQNLTNENFAGLGIEHGNGVKTINDKGQLVAVSQSGTINNLDETVGAVAKNLSTLRVGYRGGGDNGASTVTVCNRNGEVTTKFGNIPE